MASKQTDARNAVLQAMLERHHPVTLGEAFDTGYEAASTRYQERITELEKLAQDVAVSGYGDAVMGMRDTARALLEVPDEDHN